MTRLFIRGILAIVLLGMLVFGYGLLVEPRLILDSPRYEVRIPGLPAEWTGARIAVFSDMQVGMWFANLDMVERAVAHTLEAEPAAVLLPGDFVYSRDPAIPTQVDTVVDLLEPLADAGIPMYAVLGNHDYAVDAADEVRTGLEALGVEVLSNASTTLGAPGGDGGALHVVGIGPLIPGHSRPEAAFADVPADAPRIAMMHNPGSFARIDPGQAPLSVAGHTHCGQIALPGTLLWSWLEVRLEDREVVDGWAPPGYGARGNRLFVTCGIGFSLMPVRIGAPPQVVIFELVDS